MSKSKRRFVQFPIPVEKPTVNIPGTGWVVTTNNPNHEDHQRFYSRYHDYESKGIWNSNDIVYEHHAHEHFGVEYPGRKVTPHMQGIIAFRTPKTFADVRKLFPRSYVKIARENFVVNWIYINKEVDSIGYGDLREGMLSWPNYEK